MPTATTPSPKRVNQVVTPYAFGVADELLGKPLAKPWRRLIALLIDLSIVALLASLSWMLLAGVLLLVSLSAVIRWRKRPERRGAQVFLILVALVSALMLAFQIQLMRMADGSASKAQVLGIKLEVDLERDEPELNYELSTAEPPLSINLAALKNANGQPLCTPEIECDIAFFSVFVKTLVEDGYSHLQANEIVSDLFEWLASKELLAAELQDVSFSELMYELHIYEVAQAEAVPDVGIVAWAKGFLQDLGLSFGWAAVYFSVLTAWWNGQTLGKWLFGMRVVSIDGKALDLWSSFGRYGGYSAGLATGLLGFMQIFWDPNRQAIQDKISETLVLRTVRDD